MAEIKPEQVPEAVARAMNDAMLREGSTFKDIAAAALNAWPGVFENPAGDYLLLKRNALILPFPPQENPDD